MTAPPSTAVSPVTRLLIRILTFISLLISVIILATNTFTLTTADSVEAKVKFNDFYAYRYLLSATVIGLAYTLLQSFFTILLLSTGNQVGGDGMLKFDFYGDKIISYVLATGAAASFGTTQDLKSIVDRSDSGFDKYLKMADVATSLCLLGFVFAAVSSVFSSYALPKRV